jgi:hypothetical protein|tara:strand:+ start:275 stop:691 length:417 start_codon:yes stop_codon:yes gene_type:complete
MRLFNINGRLQKKSVSKYLINWNKKSRSKVQFKTKKFLEPFWKGHIVYEEFPVYGSRMTVDILNATKKLAIEVQGKQHGEFNKFFHNNSRLKYLEGIKRDIKKAEWLESNGFILLEIEEDEVESLSLDFFLEKFGMTI